MPRIRPRTNGYIRWILDEHDIVNGDIFPPTGERLPPINWRLHILAYLTRRALAAYTTYELECGRVDPDRDWHTTERKMARLRGRWIAYRAALNRAT